MEILGLNAVGLSAIGLFVMVIAAALFAVTISLTLLGLVLALIYHRNRTILIPNATLFIMGFLEVPVKQLAWLFGIDEAFLDHMVVEIRNKLYYNAYSRVPYSERILFLPQCLRNPKCPAPLEAEGLICKSCGRCGICKIKEYAEQLGYRVFIAPGSTLIKRMIKKHKPKAIIGVGCVLEAYEGTRLMASLNVPTQGVILERDGCVDTRVDVSRILELLHLNSTEGKNNSIRENPELSALAENISKMWNGGRPTELEIKSAQKASEQGAWRP